MQFPHIEAATWAHLNLGGAKLDETLVQLDNAKAELDEKRVNLNAWNTSPVAWHPSTTGGNKTKLFELQALAKKGEYR